MKRRMFYGTVLMILSAMVAVAADDESEFRNLNVSVVASTVPGNGDINPYGVARFPPPSEIFRKVISSSAISITA